MILIEFRMKFQHPRLIHRPVEIGNQIPFVKYLWNLIRISILVNFVARLTNYELILRMER